MKKTIFLLIFVTINFMLSAQEIYTSAYVTNNAFAYAGLSLNIDGGKFTNNNTLKIYESIAGTDTSLFDGNGLWIACGNQTDIYGDVKFYDFINFSQTTVHGNMTVINNMFLDSMLLLNNAQLSIKNQEFSNNNYIAMTPNSVLKVNFFDDTIAFLPVGDYNLFSPVLITSPEKMQGFAYFSVANEKYYGINTDQYLNRYWSVNTDSLTGNGKLAFFYHDTDIVGQENTLSAQLFEDYEPIFEGDMDFQNNELFFNTLHSGIYTAQQSNNSQVEVENYQIYAFENTIFIECNELSDVYVCDINGKILKSAQNTLSEAFVMPASGVYIVNIINENQNISKKVFVK